MRKRGYKELQGEGRRERGRRRYEGWGNYEGNGVLKRGIKGGSEGYKRGSNEDYEGKWLGGQG